jgi:hypothetical protein
VATWSLEYRRIGNPGGGWPDTDFAQKVLLPVRGSGRLIIAQQFTAGIRRKGSESVERTADDIGPILSACFSIVRFTDYPRVTADPSDEPGSPRGQPAWGGSRWAILGRPLMRTGERLLCQAARHLRSCCAGRRSFTGTGADLSARPQSAHCNWPLRRRTSGSVVGRAARAIHEMTRTGGHTKTYALPVWVRVTFVLFRGSYHCPHENESRGRFFQRCRRLHSVLNATSGSTLVARRAGM